MQRTRYGRSAAGTWLGTEWRKGPGSKESGRKERIEVGSGRSPTVGRTHDRPVRRLPTNGLDGCTRGPIRGQSQLFYSVDGVDSGKW